MLAEKVINIFPIKSNFLKLLIGSILTVLMISLGMVYISELLLFKIGSAIPSAFAALGAAIFAARFKN